MSTEHDNAWRRRTFRIVPRASASEIEEDISEYQQKFLLFFLADYFKQSPEIIRNPLLFGNHFRTIKEQTLQWELQRRHQDKVEALGALSMESVADFCNQQVEVHQNLAGDSKPGSNRFSKSLKETYQWHEIARLAEDYLRYQQSTVESLKEELQKEKYELIVDFIQGVIPRVPGADIKEEARDLQESFNSWKAYPTGSQDDFERVREIVRDITFGDLVETADFELQVARRTRRKLSHDKNIEVRMKVERQVFYWRRALNVLAAASSQSSAANSQA